MAINTAVTLHQAQGDSVVLVDADYAAPALDVALNLHSEGNIADLLPRLARLDEDLVSSLLATHASGVRVLLAPPPSDLTNPITLPQVQHFMAILRRMFQWVVVDLGVELGDTAFGILEGADLILVSVVPEMVGLRNSGLLLDTLRDRGVAPTKIWPILNRFDLRGGVNRRDIEKRLGLKIKHSVPDDQPLATLSINRGIPLVTSHPRSAVARSIGKLAEELKDELSAEGSDYDKDVSGQENGTRRFGRLF